MQYDTCIYRLHATRDDTTRHDTRTIVGISNDQPTILLGVVFGDFFQCVFLLFYFRYSHDESLRCLCERRDCYARERERETKDKAGNDRNNLNDVVESENKLWMTMTMAKKGVGVVARAVFARKVSLVEGQTEYHLARAQCLNHKNLCITTDCLSPSLL